MEMSLAAQIVLNPADYCNFQFRGQGQANIVVGVQHRKTGKRSVWRIAKLRRSKLISTDPKTDTNMECVIMIMQPFFGQQFLPKMAINRMRTSDVHEIGKMVSLPAAQVVEKFEDLRAMPAALSALRVERFRFIQGETTEVRPLYLTILQMDDVTQLPTSIDSETGGDTITVELKPKVGIFQIHNGISTRYCQNCVMMVEKVVFQKKYPNLQHSCRLDMFSGHYDRTFQAISAAFEQPHNSLTVFKNGTQVHEGKAPLGFEELSQLLFGDGSADVEDLIEAICLALTDSPSKDHFALHSTSVLSQILEGQKIDDVGVVEAHRLLMACSEAEQEALKDKGMFVKKGLEKLREPNLKDPVHTLQRYLLASTMKDCSVMISFRLQKPSSSPITGNVISTSTGKVFQLSTKVVDLDPKTSSNIVSGFERYTEGVRFMNENPEAIGSLKPCM